MKEPMEERTSALSLLPLDTDHLSRFSALSLLIGALSDLFLFKVLCILASPAVT
jgi:hypothetical protein